MNCEQQPNNIPMFRVQGKIDFYSFKCPTFSKLFYNLKNIFLITKELDVKTQYMIAFYF